MAFDIRLWARVSLSLNTTHITEGNIAENSGAPTLYTYKSNTDTIEIISAGNYFGPVANDVKVGDLIYIFGINGGSQVRVTGVAYIPQGNTVTVTPASGINTVTNPTGGSTNELPKFSDNTGQVIRGSGLRVNIAVPSISHMARAEARKTETLSPIIELTDLGYLQFTQGVGTIYVDGLTGMQFIDNDFGPETQVCTLITGDLPGSSTSPSALLELQSTTGVFVPTRMTSLQRNALTTPPDGSILYDETLKKVVFKEDGAWNIGADGDGTVTSIVMGTGLSSTQSPLITTGTISIADTTVTPGTYTNATVTVNQQGQLTFAASGSSGGGGTVTSINFSGAFSSSQNPLVSSGNVDLANSGVTPGTYTNATVTVTEKGIISLASNGTPATPGVTEVTGTTGNISSTGGTTPQINLVPTGVAAGTYANPSSIGVDVNGRISTIVGGSAPVPGNLTAKYLLQQADVTLPNAQSLGDLMGGPANDGKGLLWSDKTGTVGVVRLAQIGVDYPSVASVNLAQTTANTAILSALDATTLAVNAAAAASTASVVAGQANSTATTAFGLATALALSKYIVQTANAFIPNSQSLGAFRDSGILKTNYSVIGGNDTGVLSIAVADTDYSSVAAMTATRAFKYVTAQSDTLLPNAQNLGALTTGIVKNTVTTPGGIPTGTLSIATAGTDYATPASVTAVMTAPFILTTPTAGFSGSQALSALGTGLLKNTGGTGVLTVGGPGTDYYAPNFPTVIQDGHGTATENLAVGKDAGIAWTGTNNTAFGIRALESLVTGDGNTGIGLESGGTPTSATNCTWLGYLARNSANGLTNATAVGANAQVAVSNAVSLGYQCFVGINNSSPAYALDIKSGGGGPDALIRLQSSSIPSAPPNADEGIFSVNNGRPHFVSASATTIYSGLLVAISSGGGNATTGTLTLNGTTPVVVNTTAVNATTHIVFTREGVGGGTFGVVSVSSRVVGTSFSVVSDRAGDTATMRWTILNSV